MDTETIFLFIPKRNLSALNPHCQESQNRRCTVDGHLHAELRLSGRFDFSITALQVTWSFDKIWISTSNDRLMATHPS
jgi:hypothetical protein